VITLRDVAIDKGADIISHVIGTGIFCSQTLAKGVAKEIMERVLTIPELAVVDRKAMLLGNQNNQYTFILPNGNWVKEVDK